MTPPDTKTPRTDAKVKDPMDAVKQDVVSADFARTLERELADKTKAHAELLERSNANWDKWKAATQRIAELEAAADPGVHSCSPTCQRPNCVLRRRVVELEAHAERLAGAIPYPALSAGSANAIAHELEMGEAARVTTTAKAKAAWLRAIAHQLNDMEMVQAHYRAAKETGNSPGLQKPTQR